MDGATGVLILGSLHSSFPVRILSSRACRKASGGGGGGPHPKEKVLWLGCQGHVVAMWQDPGVLAPLLPAVRPSVAAPPPPAAGGKGGLGRPGGPPEPEGKEALAPSPQRVLEPEQQLGPIF